MLLMRGSIKAGGKLEVEIPGHYNTLMYLLDGSVQVNGKSAKKKDLVWFNNDGNTIIMSGNEETRFIILSGEPIGEKVTSYGPFVMNTQTEILQAMRDSQMGKMGVLIENF